MDDDEEQKKFSRKFKKLKRDLLKNEGDGTAMQVEIDPSTFAEELNREAFSEKIDASCYSEPSQSTLPVQSFKQSNNPISITCSTERVSTSSEQVTSAEMSDISAELGVQSETLGTPTCSDLPADKLMGVAASGIEHCVIGDSPWFDEAESSELGSAFSSRFAQELEDIEGDFRSELFSEEPKDMPTSDPIYPGAPISIIESITAILSFVISEHISGGGLGRLLALIMLHIPKVNSFLQSTRQLFKLLEDKDEPLQISYHCSLCLKKLDSSFSLCNTCTDPNRTVSYLIHFPLEHQVRKLFSRPGFQNDVNYKFSRSKKNDNNIEDILDGEAYKQAEVEPAVGTSDLTLTWNADGLQVFNSSNFSLWPFFLVVNELPPLKRYYSENMLIGGIWCGMTKPHPNVFLQPIYNDLEALRKGIVISDSLTVRAKLICGTCDAPARAYFLNMKLHSGYFSCHLCLSKGEFVAGTVTVFPYEENPRARTLEEYKEHVKFAVQNRVIEKKNNHLLNDERCCGIKGPTVLSYMVDDMFKSTTVDAMHCVYLGVTRQMITLMFDAEHKEKDFSAHPQLEVVNQRMVNITVPHFLDRAPETIDKLVHWKATMFRAFLFHFSLCVLSDILKPKYFEHFLLLVKGIALLNSSSISSDDITLADLLLNQFVDEFQSLYGKRHMSYNLHMLRHLAKMVRHLGPLWAISCFLFEDMNGRIAQLIHGTRYAGIQVCSNLSILKRLPLMVYNLTNDDVKQYCLQLRHKGLPLKVTEKISDDIKCIGDFSKLDGDNGWILDELKQVVLQPKTDSVHLFQRLYKHRILYVSSNYASGKRVSSFVKYSSNNTFEMGNIVTFVKLVDKEPLYYAVIQRLQTSLAFETNIVSISHMHQVHPPHVGIDIIPVTKLEIVLFKTGVSETVYLSEPLNHFELE